jgi:transcriptional regulator with XRE-family HTH domain
MKTLSAIISDLQRVKGTGRWEEIAKACGTDYGTIARIAQGRIKSPGIVICERISDALDAPRLQAAPTDPQPTQQAA